jgi:O-antigen ligase
MRQRPLQQYFVYGVFILSLWSSVTNLVPASVSFVLLVPLVPYALVQNPSVPPTVTTLAALYGYFILSTLLYGPTSLVEPDFYRRDGNFFVTMFPILLGGILTFNTDVEKVMSAFVKWTTLCGVPFLLFFLATHANLVASEDNIYHFLFISHNAAGGFLSMVVAFAIGLYVEKKRPLLMGVILAVELLALWVTKSRGSVFGLFVALCIMFVLRERYLKTLLVATAGLTALVLSFTYPMWLSLGKPPGIMYIGGTFFSEAQGDVINATFLDRIMFLWPRAVHLFLSSPIFGTGFGSFNDIPYQLVGIPHVFMYNQPYRLIFDAAHAHNTFLHVLAETGLVGLGLLIAFLYQVWKYIDTLEQPSVRLGMKLAFWNAIFSSLTEHRLFTPSEMLPFTLMLAIALAGRTRVVRSVAPALLPTVAPTEAHE